MTGYKKHIWPALLVLPLCAALLLFGCARRENTAEPQITSVAQLDTEGRIIGVPIGTSSVDAVQGYFKHASINVITGDGFLELKSGNIDAYASAYANLQKGLASGSLEGMTILDEDIGEAIEIVAGISRKAHIPGLKAEIDAFLTDIQQNGTMKDIYHRWIEEGSEEMPDIPKPENPDRKLVVGTTGLTEPFSFYTGDTINGMDIELIYRLGLAMNAEVEIKTYDFYGIVTALESGDCDCVFSNLNATPERREAFDFSIPVYSTYTRLLVRDVAAIAEETPFLTRVQNSFRKTFIVEDRWRLILRGIGMTMFISFFAVLFGTVLGFGVCWLRGSRVPCLRRLAAVYIAVLQGTPHVVLLLILYYVVFAGSNVPGTWVAILAFAVNCSANVGDVFRSGIDAIDRGQTEAALALGYTRRRAFTRIVLPQAAMSIFPVYKGQVVMLVKMTSIVGYISVQDLTKASDLIRSRTYEAFFPLIVTAALYFAISWVLTALLSAVQLKLQPNRKNRTVKGVTMK